MLGFLIGIAIRQCRPGGTAPVPTAPTALMIEGGDRLLLEDGSLLLLE